MSSVAHTLNFTMAGLDPATQPVRVGGREISIALAVARLLGGRVKPGHGEAA